MGFIKRMLTNNRKESKTPPGITRRAPSHGRRVMGDIAANVEYVRNALFHTDDLQERSFEQAARPALLVYLSSVCDLAKIHEAILKPMLSSEDKDPERIIPAADMRRLTDLESGIELLLRGYSLLFRHEREEYYAIETAAIVQRSVDEPTNEKAVQGAHNGFIESLHVNLQLVRRQIGSRNLVVRRYSLGNMTKTEASLIYLNDLADPEIVEDIDQRLRAIDADNLMNGYLVLEYIEDRSFSPFPQILQTERPDRVAGNLLEGRVALLMEGTSAALLMPTSFFVFYQSPDDYNSRSLAGSFIRLLRLFSFLIAITLPAYYIAVVTFHYEVIPMELFYQIKGSVERIPYPPILEALFMELTIELLREASIRLPTPVSQSIGIVGGLVIGDAVVRVGLVSYPMIIVVALTAIASFVVPSHEMSYSVRLLRFPVMIAASMFGFIGIAFCLTAIFVHLCKLKSFGTPYFAPVAPFRILDWKDALVRLPYWKLNERPNDPRPQKLVQEHRSKEGGRHDQE
ncbi:spore germination protein [Cohnella phaseoli]|uniref:Spore germination protein KA n=1 Tax=Cohnella phaseoli TaxID=456490 RepID=A0A3D9HT96_9BACL|nr:spore germination protein [Cohnella phaseoli]RED52734.1 spore germination protein KA [Cohnella phaseoli]